MRFTRLQIHEVCIPFRFSFKHALAERREARNLILVLHTDQGTVGYGEAIPRDYLTGETLETAIGDLQTRWWPKLRGLSFEAQTVAATPDPEDERVSPAPGELLPGTTHAFFEQLKPLYEEADAERKTASYAGLDIAALDCWARACGIPGNCLFGRKPSGVSLTAPIGSSSLRSSSWQARLFRWLGFGDYKVKVGRRDDLERLTALRGIIGKNADLRVDANAAWSEEEALKKIRAFEGCAVSSVEQPIPAGDADALGRVQQASGVPLMADESLCTCADAENLLAHTSAQLWNLRLAKIGGFSGMLTLIRKGEDAGIRHHLGVLVGESSCLAAAQRACLGLAEWAYVEYGFPRLLLSRDPFWGGPSGYFGIGHPLGATPGLGIRLRKRVLDAITVKQIELT